MGQEDEKKTGETPDSSENTEQQTGSDGKPFDAERAQNTIKTLRDEIKALKAAAKEAQTKAEREKMSESERLNAQLAEWQAKTTAAETAAAERELRLKVIGKAAKAGFQDPDDAWHMLDLAEVGEDIDGALADLLKAKPYLGRASGTTNGGGNGAGTTPKISAGNPASGGGLTIDQIRAMTPEQALARRDEIRKVLAGQQ